MLSTLNLDHQPLGAIQPLMTLDLPQYSGSLPVSPLLLNYESLSSIDLQSLDYLNSDSYDQPAEYMVSL